MTTLPNTGIKPSPKLPEGNAKALRGISENFSFHASPESFIASRVIQLAQQQPDLLDKRTVVRARILNRNVAIVSGYDHIRQILVDQDEDGEPQYVAASAYDAFMSSFFPVPNLLLSDGCPHKSMRFLWDEKMRLCHAQRWTGQIQEVVNQFYESEFAVGAGQSQLESQTFELYEKMKSFAWRVLLKCFLNLAPEDELFSQVQSLHETLLRGQFSLMPVSLNTGFWKSPRKLGIQARAKLQELIAKRLREITTSKEGDQLTFEQDGSDLHLANHVLMMTSSLAVKGMASLLTAFLLNIFQFRQADNFLCDLLTQLGDEPYRLELLRSIYYETERLSPPIVGIMRRSAAENILRTAALNEANIILPKGWDVWLYFVGGGRDPASFGEQNDTFDPTRYLQHDTPEPLGFGLGPKACLGRHFVRETALKFVEKCLSDGCRMNCDYLSPGVQGWLGWIIASPKQWASDMKQLPTQHPSKPVLVQVVK